MISLSPQEDASVLVHVCIFNFAVTLQAFYTCIICNAVLRQKFNRSIQISFSINYQLNCLIRINLPLFSTVVPACVLMFLSCRPFVAITTLSIGLVGVEVTSVSAQA